MTRKLTNKISPIKDGTDVAVSDEQKAKALANNSKKVHKLTAIFGDGESIKIIQQMAEIIRKENHRKNDIRLATSSEIKKIAKKNQQG